MHEKVVSKKQQMKTEWKYTKSEHTINILFITGKISSENKLLGWNEKKKSHQQQNSFSRLFSQQKKLINDLSETPLNFDVLEKFFV